jgi:hypothetical protein
MFVILGFWDDTDCHYIGLFCLEPGLDSYTGIFSRGYGSWKRTVIFSDTLLPAVNTRLTVLTPLLHRRRNAMTTQIQDMATVNFRQLLSQAKRVVVLTGAGVSAESGKHPV